MGIQQQQIFITLFTGDGGVYLDPNQAAIAEDLVENSARSRFNLVDVLRQYALTICSSATLVLSH